MSTRRLLLWLCTGLTLPGACSDTDPPAQHHNPFEPHEPPDDEQDPNAPDATAPRDGDSGSSFDASPPGEGAEDAGADDASTVAPPRADAGGPDAGDSDDDASTPSGIPLVPCSTMSPGGPCGTFTTSSGVEIQLGPYGAQIEPNVGEGFENPIASGDSDNNFSCRLFASTFRQDAEATARQLDITGLEMDLYTVYRPVNWPEGQKMPILTWGNGTCAKPEGYGALLRHVASHGFFVIAANSRWVGSGNQQRKAIDFALAANADPESPYYQLLDPAKVGAMGHSQGAMGTTAAASDSRIKAVILFNGGERGSKPFLLISGDRDLGSPTAATLESAVNASAKAAYLFYHMIPGTGSADGHLTLMLQPDRVAGATTAWFKFLLNNDTESRDWFVGASCKLCGHDAEYEFGQKGL